MALRWHCHGSTWAPSWCCHGTGEFAMPWHSPWRGHDTATALPWQCHGTAKALPWQPRHFFDLFAIGGFLILSGNFKEANTDAVILTVWYFVFCSSSVFKNIFHCPSCPLPSDPVTVIKQAPQRCCCTNSDTPSCSCAPCPNMGTMFLNGLCSQLFPHCLNSLNQLRNSLDMKDIFSSILFHINCLS